MIPKPMPEADAPWSGAPEGPGTYLGQKKLFGPGLDLMKWLREMNKVATISAECALKRTLRLLSAVLATNDLLLALLTSQMCRFNRRCFHATRQVALAQKSGSIRLQRESNYCALRFPVGK